MSKAAEKLHLSRMTVYRRMSKYGIARSSSAPGRASAVAAAAG
jgi:DNA-binding NtrC family response regulator